MRKVIILLILNLSFAQLPYKSIELQDEITDMIIDNDKLFISSYSNVNIYDLKLESFIKTIKIPQIKDFLGDFVNAKIFGIDKLNEKILILSEGEKGGKNIFLYQNNKLSKIISDKKRQFISKAKFVDNNIIIYSLLSNELILHDIKNNKQIYKKDISLSKFSDFVLSEDKKDIYIADESGRVFRVDIKNANIKKIYKGENLDNIFQIDFKSNTILTAGQDRKVGVYTKDNSYHKEALFLVYAAKLSDEAKIGAFSYNENNDIMVFDIKNQKNIKILEKNQAIISKILFYKNMIITANSRGFINFYKD